MDLEDERQLLRKPRNKMEKNDMIKIGVYKIIYLVASVAVPIIMSYQEEALGTNCKTSPHYGSHIILLAI